MAPRPEGLLKRGLVLALVMAAFGAILALTLTPVSGPDSGQVSWCLLCGELGLADALGNVVLFVPLAMALRWSGVPGRGTIGLGLLLSLTIEIVQLRVVPGRDATLGDVLWNTLGAALGVVLVWWFPLRRRSALRALAATTAALGVIAVTGLLQRPSFPPTTYYGQWTANLAQNEWYRGRVLSADIGGLPLPSWRLADSRAVRERFLEGVPLLVRAIAGPRTERLAPLFSIADAEQRGILLVGPSRDDLVLRVSTSAIDFRVRQPSLRWREALVGVQPGDTLNVAVRRTARGYCLQLNGRERCGLAYTAGRAWGFVQFPSRLPAAFRAALDCLFMAMLGLPIGLVMRRNRTGYAVAAIALAGAVAVPSLVGLAPTPPLQVGALALGILTAALAP